ncbi:MAG: response regulator [Pseudomonadales bacterium]|jgi:twitching motility two-component system response regulator PilH|nr:response regulator [Pseudomonadales bacterium]MCP5321062.1 response regulator [Pseudomonadales bacterium]MCP5337332.1 response regulator [Pseudomonadales bacterium]
MARILIVDDSPTENFSIGSLLGRQGHDVIAAESGEEGIRLAREQRPDLILMDIVMPGLNGFQATRQLTRDPQTAMIPIVILTSKSQDTDRVWAERQGAKGYLTKPVEEAVLLSTITHVLGGMQR